MSRDWDLDDLTTLGQICGRFGVTKQAASMWPRRYPDFPPALLAVGRTAWHSRTQVVAWHADTFPPKPPRLRPLAEIKGPRGECAVCGRQVALVKTGLTRRHGLGRWHDWCKGSQELPKAVPDAS